MPKSSFLQDFIDLNTGMWTSNNALTPNPDKEPSQLESGPQHWPFLLRGVRICSWEPNKVKYYLLGNPLIWWFTTASLVFLSALWIIYYIRNQRLNFDFRESRIN